MSEFLKDITPREYQQKIFETCINKNCLVVLPTGLGKTLIALMLTIKRMQEYPGKKVVFLAPTKPLAEQHIISFKKYLPELFADMQLFTGAINSIERKKIWQTADIIFSTPQCVANDLRKELYSLKDVCLLIE
ncbi:MAG: Type III restriction protein res subunit, partial [archaeon GW2011_AR13]